MALSRGNSAVSTATTSHIHALQSKHATLEAQLHDEMNRPIPDSSTIQLLKKRKLALKEEIARH